MGKPGSLHSQRLIIVYVRILYIHDEHAMICLDTVHCTLHCTLYTVHCTLYTVHCTLYTVQVE